jgi:hypothetical protein
MLKTLSYILAILFIILACFPCMDEDICMDEQKAGIAFTTADHDHTDHEADLCSPFCICNCCRTQINQPLYFFFDVKKAGFSSPNFPELHAAISAVPHNIWQPPRLS